jgi:16S rRNA (guanine527-N7)-methyltransferase
MTSALADAIEGLGLQLPATRLARLEQYRDLLLASANEFNLTSLRDPKGIERRHIVESLSFGVFLQERGLLPRTGDEGPSVSRRVLDIGTGAGLPGIPLKVAWPEMHVTLLESVGKKCRFLERAAGALGLDDVTVIEGRAEDIGRDPAHRETYDLAVARAVAPLPVLLEYALPALRVGGHLAAPKGSAAASELAAASAALDALGGRLDGVAPFLPPHGLPQSVVIVEKVAPTPDRYPRRAGVPSKRPL